MRDDEFANQVLHRQRREMRAHGPAQIVDLPILDTAQPIDPRLRFREAVDGLFAGRGREQEPAGREPRQGFDQFEGAIGERDLVRPVALHPRCRDCPEPVPQIEFRPARVRNLALAQPGQDQQPEQRAIGVAHLAGRAPHPAQLVILQHAVARVRVCRSACQAAAVRSATPGSRTRRCRSPSGTCRRSRAKAFLA